MAGDWLARFRYPRLAILLLVGAGVLLLAGLLAVTEIGSPTLTFRVGVLGYLLLLLGGAGYASLLLARRLDVGP